MGEVGFLGFVQVVQQPPQGHGGGGIPRREPGQGLFAELGLDPLFRLPEKEPPLAAVFHTAAEFFPQGIRQGRFAVCAVA